MPRKATARQITLVDSDADISPASESTTPPQNEVEATEDDYDPQELQKALHYIDHPMHPFACFILAQGKFAYLHEALMDAEELSLENVKREALSVCGLLQKIAFWCDTEFWNMEHKQ